MEKYLTNWYKYKSETSDAHSGSLVQVFIRASF